MANTCSEGEESGLGTEDTCATHRHDICLVHCQTSSQSQADDVMLNHHLGLDVIFHHSYIGPGVGEACGVSEVVFLTHGRQFHPADGEVDEWAESRSKHCPRG